MDYEQILYQVADGVATITLNRPDKLNAFTHQMAEEMIAAFDAIDADDSVRAAIVTGAGRAFCAGADLSAGGATFNRGGGSPDAKEGTEPARRDAGGLVTLRIYDLKKPIVAAINGPAVGIGATMLLPMDVRLASREARFGFVFARRGIVPEAASSWFLPRVVGISQALDWCLSGRVFPAEEAREARLVKSLHEPEALMEAARAVALDIAQNTSAISVALIRQMMWKMLGADHPMAAHKIDSRGVAWTGRSADAKEGVTSFLEKRPAEFRLMVSRDMPDFFPWWEEQRFE